MTIATQAEHKQQGKSCKVLQVCKDMMQVYYGTGNCEPSPGHGRAQGWSMQSLLTRPHTRTKHEFSDRAAILNTFSQGQRAR